MDAKGISAHRPWHLYRVYSIPTHDKHQWLLLQFIVLLMMDAKGVSAHQPWHLYRIYSIPPHDKHQWLLLQFIVLLMTDAKGVRNMYSILVVVNKHNTVIAASCWFIIYYRLVMHGNSNIKYVWPVSPVRVLSIIILVPLPCPLRTCCCSSLSHGGSNSSCYWSAGTAVCSTTVWCSAWTLLRFISRESCTRNNNCCLKPPSLNLPVAVHETKKKFVSPCWLQLFGLQCFYPEGTSLGKSRKVKWNQIGHTTHSAHASATEFK